MAVFNQAVAVATAKAAADVTFLGTNFTAKIYSGTIPATPETTPGGTLLGTVTFASATNSGPVVTTSDPAAVNPVANGTAAWARILKSDGTTVFGDVDVTATGGGGSIQLTTLALTTAVPVDVAAVTITEPSV